VHGLLTGTEETGFDFIWRYWLKDETPEQVAHSLFPLGRGPGQADVADGLVLLAGRSDHAGLVPLLREMQVPFVLAYARSQNPDVLWAACDNRGGVAQAVAHLVSLGHRGIGFIGGSPMVADFAERRQGYLDGMAEAGLEVDPSLVHDTGLRQEMADLRPGILRLLQRSDPPTAIICHTDVAAFSLIEVAWEIGLSVPQDLAVIGFDDSEEATQTVPPLTTIRQPVSAVAGMSCYLLSCAIVGQEPETGGWQVDLPVSFIVRESCGASLRQNAGAERAPGPAAEAQEMRREMEWQMRQLVAMNEEMQELLYVASHDLRSPLITIQGFTNALDRKCAGALDERGKDYLRRIQGSVGSMGELIDTLLALSRAHNQPLNLKLTQPLEVLRRIAADLGGPIAERKVHVILPRRLPAVIADEVGLYQIFMNLVSNAIKFMGDQPHPMVFIGYRARSHEHEFSVQDNGVGIPQEHQHEIFQAFRRLGGTCPPETAESRGAGIGLTIVRRMVLRHGGRIWVESEQGKGTTFRFTLPRRANAA
jgi:signal transduction histidine kinase